MPTAMMIPRPQTQPAAAPLPERPVAIEIRDLTAFYGGVPAVRGVDLDIPDGLITAVIGPSGCGKSTLIRCLNRMHEVTPGASLAGRILLFGRDATRLDPVLLRRNVGMVFQRPNPFPTMSVFQNVASGLTLNGLADRSTLAGLVEASLRKAALWDEVKDKLHAPGLGLSGGQQQRLCLARTLAMEPEVILLDEPTSGLDPISTAKIEATLLELKNNYTMVLVSNNTKQIARATDRVAFLLMSHIIEIGDTKQVFTIPANQKTDDYISGRFG